MLRRLDGKVTSKPDGFSTYGLSQTPKPEDEKYIKLPLGASSHIEVSHRPQTRNLMVESKSIANDKDAHSNFMRSIYHDRT